MDHGDNISECVRKTDSSGLFGERGFSTTMYQSFIRPSYYSSFFHMTKKSSKGALSKKLNELCMLVNLKGNNVFL